jgi:hypothetical protein
MVERNDVGVVVVEKMPTNDEFEGVEIGRG